MVVNCIELKVKPNTLKKFISLSEKNQNATLLEPECLRFDILQSEDDPNDFMFYEFFMSHEGMAAHKETNHIKEWKSKTADMLLSESEKKYSLVAPVLPEHWRTPLSS